MQPENELPPTRELLSEIRQERDRLVDQVRQDATELAELRQLLANTQQQLQTLLIERSEPHARRVVAPDEELVLVEHAQGLPGWWTMLRDGKQSLGASLTVTGFVALAAGIILHFALRASIVGTATHLGYIIGLFGLLSLLIGLVLVF